jgi:hypothetical protein
MGKRWKPSGRGRPSLACALAFPALAHAAPGPAECTALANLQKFPSEPTRITLTQFNDATATLSVPCRVEGIMEERTGVRGIPYGTRFEVRLPVDWNGRVIFQGGYALRRRCDAGYRRADAHRLGGVGERAGGGAVRNRAGEWPARSAMGAPRQRGPAGCEPGPGR